jgi:hypothetical protein
VKRAGKTAAVDPNNLEVMSVEMHRVVIMLSLRMKSSTRSPCFTGMG